MSDIVILILFMITWLIIVKETARIDHLEKRITQLEAEIINGPSNKVIKNNNA